MADEKNASLESRETGKLEESGQVFGKEDSLGDKLGKIVQIDDSELPQSIKDEFREK